MYLRVLSKVWKSYIYMDIDPLTMLIQLYMCFFLIPTPSKQFSLDFVINIQASIIESKESIIWLWLVYIFDWSLCWILENFVHYRILEKIFMDPIDDTQPALVNKKEK